MILRIFGDGKKPFPMGCAEGLSPCLIGEFSALLAMRLGKFPNKLWYFPLVNIRTAASVLTPYIFSPRFFGGCIIRLADWTCLSCFIGSADWDKGLPHR